jgi:Ni/Fe-hydrogenase subunit HybB-like protein
LAVSMATAAILKKSTLNSTTSHGMIFLQGLRCPYSLLLIELPTPVISSYYYITPTVVEWCIAILRFFFTIIILILIILILILIIIIIIIIPHIFVRSISWRCLNQTLWNLVGISCHVKLCL